MTQQTSSYFPFELSQFQQTAIDAIRNDKHCLVTAHTGSGKTVPAEFAIQYFAELGKKVIYTSPIKALSNQKLHDFRAKYPHISFGIVTGDIEDNKEAQVLIMTTEILANALINRRNQKTYDDESPLNPPNTTDTPSTPNSSVFRFDMNYEDDLAAVVFDEVHYISDPDRGVAWEQSIMLMPSQVVMIMLSATISNPEVLANWVTSVSKKEVVLAPTTERVVPLRHYVYVPNITEKVSKVLPKEIVSRFRKYEGRLTTIKDGEGTGMKVEVYQDIKSTLTSMESGMNFANALFTLIPMLKQQDMLPALCFVFSREKTVKLALKTYNSCPVSLFPDHMLEGQDIGKKIQKECRHLLSSKLGNYEDFLQDPEFQTLLMLLSKGIAYHHAGMLPIMRELVEMLDGKGYVRLLFATETFAVGVNMPTKTVVFTSLSKRDNRGFRDVLPHEYTQMAGRAGRRGLDKIGHAIILPDRLPTTTEMKNIISGHPPSIKSNYKVSLHLVLGIVKGAAASLDEIVEKASQCSENSLLAPSQVKYANKLKKALAESEKELDMLEERVNSSSIDVQALNKYCENEAKLKTGMLRAKAIKQIQRENFQLCKDYPTLERDATLLDQLNNKRNAVKYQQEEYALASEYLKNEVKAVVEILLRAGAIIKQDSDGRVVITKKGILASYIHEAYSLGVAHYMDSPDISYCANEDYTAADLACLLSILNGCIGKRGGDNALEQNDYYTEGMNLAECYEKCYDIELEVLGQYHVSQEYTLDTKITPYVVRWIEAQSAEECSKIIREAETNSEILSGDYVKAILKTVKLSKELMLAAQEMEDVLLEKKCSEIPSLLLKYTATNQSLYV